MQRKRVGIDARCFQDGSALRGTGRYVRGLLDGLASCESDDLELVLVLDEGGRRDRDPPGMDADGRLHGLRTLRAALDVGHHSVLRRSRVQARSLARLGLDLLHVPAQYYATSHRRIAVPYVVTVLDLIPFVEVPGASPWPRGRRMRRLSRLAAVCRRADAVVAISGHTRDDCVRLLGLPRERVRVIPLGVDERFRPGPAPGGGDAAALAAHGARPPYVLYVGAQDPHKNLDSLVAAVERLRALGHDLQLVLAGRGGGPPAGEGRAWVHDAGHVPDEDLPALYRGAAVFATLSAYEGFCLPALEAMACGAPVVASDAAALPETVGDAGLRVGPFDATAAADAMQRVLDDRALARELGARGIERARRFRWNEVARAHLDVYRGALDRHRDRYDASRQAPGPP